ncbi:MAG: V-type ATP synthase subunit A, partial [Limnochordia bacterium]
MSHGRIVKVAGPLVVAEGMQDVSMFDVVRVSDRRLIGEVLEMRGDRASIQVYEETAGLGPGEPVYGTGAPLSVELGPGLIGTIFDGIQRPLEVIREMVGSNITRGIDVPALDRDKRWRFEPLVEKGAKVDAGDIIGKVQETEVVEHRIMVPVGVSGTIVEITPGEFTVEETVAKLQEEDGTVVELKMMQKWPVRVGRPYKEKLPPVEPMVTGQRVIDTLF